MEGPKRSTKKRTQRGKGTTRMSGTKRNSNTIQSCSKKEVDEMFDLIVRRGHRLKEGCTYDTKASADSFSAQDIAEASIHLGTTIDLDLAHAMVEYVHEKWHPCPEHKNDEHVHVAARAQTLSRSVVTRGDFDVLVRYLGAQHDKQKCKE